MWCRRNNQLTFDDIETQLLFKPKGYCKPNETPQYLLYSKKNWREVKNFCKPFLIERTKKGTAKGRAVIDLPTGNTAFEYGMILVKMGTTRILICTKNEFEDLFYIP